MKTNPKRIKQLLIAMVLFLCANSLPGFSNASIAEIPNVLISINGTKVQNSTLKYPVVLIDGLYYYPLTWELVQMAGFTSHYTKELGLSLTNSTTDIPPIITTKSIGPLKITRTIMPVTYKISLNGNALTSSKPIFNLSGITYVALNHTPHIGLTASYSVANGLTIDFTKKPSNLPERFNTYDTLVSNKFIRNQGTASTCWAFAANTLFEVAIAKKTGQYYDFSEDHLISNTPIPATYSSGGNFLMSSIYLQNKLGPVAEQLAPIGTNSKGKSFTVSHTLLGYTEINGNLNATKRAIYDNGAVLTSLYLNELDKNVYNSKNFAYYNSDLNLQRTHELVLVGWDDDYNKDNFTIKPKSNGAFIAQNSFGNSWGDKGFFYISYEDVHILDQVYAITSFENANSSAKQYFYDRTGVTHFESYLEKNSAVAINHFKASGTETLKRISFYTPENQMEIAIFYGKGPFSNTIGSTKLRITVPQKGYHTIDLPQPLSLTTNDSFWIAAKYVGKSPFLVPIEAPYPGIGYSMSANPGEGYIGDGSTFMDIVEVRSTASIALRATTYK